MKKRHWICLAVMVVLTSQACASKIPVETREDNKTEVSSQFNGVEENKPVLSIPAANEQLNPSATNEQVTPPTASEQLNPSATNEQVTPPTASEQLNPSATNEQVTPPAASEQLNPSATNEQVTPPAASEQLNPPTAIEAVLSPVVSPTTSNSSETTVNSVAKLTEIVEPYEPYTYEKMVEDSQLLQQQYPELISLDSIGQSVEGRELLLLKLGRGERKVFMCGAHHAREYISSTLLMKMTEVYADLYTNNLPMDQYNVKGLLDRVTLYIVPMVNPDGVNLVNNGIDTVQDPEKVKKLKMMQKTYREWKSNINGIDLNRQYPAWWEESIPSADVPASEHYKGVSEASEPEVQSVMKLCEKENFTLAVSFHSKGQVIYWADSGTVEEIPEARGIAQRYGKITGYHLMPVSEKPATFGAGFENWFRLEYKKPAFCVELTPHNGVNTPHPDEDFDELVWNPAGKSGLFFAQEALNLK